MAVGLIEPKELLRVAGVRLASVASGIKASGDKDLVLIEIEEGGKTAAVFTQNLFCAAPVTLAKNHLKNSNPRFLLINSGNANAGTGDRGMKDAIKCCDMVADAGNCSVSEVLPFSTGVIGENLPINKFQNGIPEAVGQLHKNAWLNAGRGIMTTDTLLKGMSKQVDIGGEAITITGVSKGSGMIRPDMATMLGFVATDANISKSTLQDCLHHAVEHSFNAITVDGDTSTNDACVMVATGQSKAKEIQANTSEYDVFKQAVTEVCEYLAQAIIRDGEGATKFVTIEVVNAISIDDAKKIAYTVAHSPLVKTALFASDPNWGRILAAVGRSGVKLDLERLEIFLNDVCIVKNGGRADSYTEAQGQAVMSQEEIAIIVDLKDGDLSARVWTSDLSYDYVKINAEYRT